MTRLLPRDRAILSRNSLEALRSYNGSRMRSVLLLLLSTAIASALAAPQRGEAPFVPVGVEYAADAGAAANTVAVDLRAVRAGGFNAITTIVRWTDAEPSQGKYAFDTLERTLAAAEHAGLRVMVRLENRAPAWLFARYPDGRRISDPKDAENATIPQPCVDHPGVRAALQAFIEAASKAVSRSPALYAIDVGSPPPSGFCLCPHTARRLEASSATRGIERPEFVQISLRDDLKWMVERTASSGTRVVGSHSGLPSVLQQPPGGWPSQDDWLMSTAVDRYGISVSGPMLAPARLAVALDGIGAASRDKGWALDAEASVAPRDLRMLTWAALARGARAASFEDLPEDTAFIGVVTRNPGLFSELRPTRPSVAILYDPRAATAAPVARAHEALFRRNIAVDFLHVDELVAATAGRYRAIVLASKLPLPAAAAVALKAFGAARGAIVNVAAEDLSDERLLERLSAAGVTPEARIDGGGGLVETRFLESSRVLMLIGLNHSSSAARVTMTFKPDVQEAIWQNMETGAGVNFIAGPSGPSYTYWFRPRDALVLMIRKDVR
jgi:hypothetical protein